MKRHSEVILFRQEDPALDSYLLSEGIAQVKFKKSSGHSYLLNKHAYGVYRASPTLLCVLYQP